MNETVAIELEWEDTGRPGKAARIGKALSLGWEVVLSGLQELWSHKFRSLLTLTLLMLGVFALVVFTSVLDGVLDKESAGLQSLGWDGTVQLTPKRPVTLDDGKRFPLSPGLKYEDIPRITAPDPKVRAFLSYASRSKMVMVQGKLESILVTGATAAHFSVFNRKVADGRALIEQDQRRHANVAVVGPGLGTRLFGGADPIGRDVMIGGARFTIVGIFAARPVWDGDAYREANGLTIPLETYMDRMDPDHKLSKINAMLHDVEATDDVSSLLLSRGRQAHYGIEDVEINDCGKRMVKYNKQLEKALNNWRVVMYSLAGTVMLVGGVGTLSIMLISFNDRRYEIGLRKSLGASDRQIFMQFLLEAAVLACLGGLLGTLASSVACRMMSAKFPCGLPLNAVGLLIAWAVAFGLSLLFGLYPACRARALSPMEAMR